MKKEELLDGLTELREFNETALMDIELYKRGKKNEIGLIASLVKSFVKMRHTINRIEAMAIEQDVWTE